MSLYAEYCCRSLFLLARHKLTAVEGIFETSRFTHRRLLLCSSKLIGEVAPHLSLSSSKRPLKSSKSLIVSQVAAYSSNTSDVTFSNILSSVNLDRCKNTLRCNKYVDLKNQSWLRGRNVRVGDMKLAAVLIPLCLVDGQPSVLFTLRSNHLPTHKGDVCFPGGMVDKTDTGPMNTALRELEEEIGLKRELVEVIGHMPQAPGANLTVLITPILGFCGDVDMKKLKIDQQEVSDVFVSSISSLCDERNIRYTTYKAKPMYTLPVYIGQKYRIWGMTAIILHHTLKLLAPNNYGAECRF